MPARACASWTNGSPVGAADEDWALRAKNATGDYHTYIDKIADPSAVGESGRPTYAQVIGAVDRNQQPGDYVLAAAGGFPGELINGWRAKEVGDFDCEYGFSCMGYEISGAWGAKMARPERRGHHVRRRRLVHDDEQRPVQLGAVGPQADRDRVRQRRLRGDQPTADQSGRRAVQQPDREHSSPRSRLRRLRRARRGDGLQQRAGDIGARTGDRRSNGRDTAIARRSSRCRPTRIHGQVAARSGRSASRRSASVRRCRQPRQQWSVDYNNRGSEHDGRNSRARSSSSAAARRVWARQSPDRSWPTAQPAW